MLVRECTEADRESLSVIYLESRINAFTWLDNSAFKAVDFDRDTADEKILVAEDEQGNLLGFVSIWMHDNFIHHLYVSPQTLRNGVGKALLTAATDLFVLPARLKCMKANRNALDFYASQGWRIESEAVDDHGAYYNMINW